MNRVILVGRSDHDNFGDSLIFALYLNHLKEKFNVFIMNSSEVFIQRLEDLGMNCSSIKTGELTFGDRIIFIGGGYFGQPVLGINEWSERFLEVDSFGKVADEANTKKIQYHVHGVEVGPIDNKKVRERISYVLTHAKTVAVRNTASKKYCEDILGLSSILMFRDVVYDETLSFYTAKFGDLKIDDKKNKLIIHATGKIFKNNPLSFIARIKFLRLAKRIGVDSVDILFDQTTYPELVPVANNYSHRIRSAGIDSNVLLYSGMENVLRCVAGSKYVITTKLHVGITALALGSSVKCYSNMPKNIRFYKEVFGGRGVGSLFQLFFGDWLSNEKIFVANDLNLTSGNYMKLMEKEVL